ncbi:hypothetical protein M407DRAFT_80126 [Tulasnella calospora MUT 4182]|uniref:O-fucosyltransferase family protein n=1 Tax=Tulasnella calospora MUT 4182 TaxID=1051891 RepID=A0A0C3QA62_9AGAM|nr:hypothetical protein M407DRAFT_80126 [Tulasnella calospora MUT 4182]
MLYVTSSGKTRISTGKLSDTFAWGDQTCRPHLDNGLAQADLTLGNREGKFRVRDFVNGPPTDLLVENIRNDTKYITTFTDAGWTNDVMTVVNMIYLGLITGRVAVVPPFSPSHIGYGTGDFPFGDFFDVPRLRSTLEHPVIEWRDLKNETSTKHDVIGCWSLFATTEGRPRGSRLHNTLGMDVSHTKVPDNTMLLNQHVSFWGLAKLGFPQGRQEALQGTTPFPSYRYKKSMTPDETFMCFDMLYYVSAFNPFEWETDYSPAWRFVGRHLHFHPNMIKLAETYIRKAFGLFEVEPIPKFISIHARRGDFGGYCGNSPKEHCLPPLLAWTNAVNDVRARLKAKYGVSISPQHVIVLSDESDDAWWAEVEKLGWKRIDHARDRTTERYRSLWYPSLIDAMLQAMGTGFVGTHGSTMSLVALRRTVDWNNGVGVMVRYS